MVEWALVLRSCTTRRFLVVGTAVVAGALGAPAGAAADPHTWVSGVGDDVNPCSRTAPCKTFAGALANTDTGGTISALDSAGFGAVTITKSVTLDGNGHIAGVLTSATNGIAIAAPAGSKVTLRGLTIENVVPCTGPGSTNGVRFTSGGAVHVIGTEVRGFPGAGVAASLTTSGSLTVEHSILRDNCTAGLSATTSGGTVTASLSHSTVTDDVTGVLSGAGANVLIGQDSVFANTTGLSSTGGGAISSFADNRVAGNATDGAPTARISRGATLSPYAPPGPTVVPGPQAPAPQPLAPIAPGTPTCVVPHLTGLTLPMARRAVGRTICQLGSVTRRPHAGRGRGLVYRQDPRPGVVQYRGAVINLTIDARPRRPRHRARGAQTGLSRAWVSGVGDDANPCSRTAPCKTIAGALLNVETGGTIDNLDPGDFAPFTVTPTVGAVTIQGSGQGSTITAVPGSTAVTINAGAGQSVTLRDLSIASTSGCAAPGSGTGIRVLSGGPIHLEHVTVTGFAGTGISIAPTADAAVDLVDSTVSDNCTTGLSVSRPGGSISLLGVGDVLRNNATALAAGDGATVRLGATSIAANTTGVTASSAATVQGWPDNQIFDNLSDGVAPVPLAFS